MTRKRRILIEKSQMTRKAKQAIKTVGWVVGVPLILVVLLLCLVYVPPVQRWAIDRAIAGIEEGSDMKVKVDHFRLHFPLKLRVGGVEIVAPTDTMLRLDTLRLDIAFAPLIRGEVKADSLLLRAPRINSLDMIEAVGIDGHIGQLYADSILFLTDDGTLTIPQLYLDHSRLHLNLADSVAEDTVADEAPSPLRLININDIRLADVDIDLDLPPSADSTRVSTHFDTASLACRIDLEGGNYYVVPLKAGGAYIGYDTGHNAPATGFDPTHINISDADISIDSLSYMADGTLYVGIDSISGKERSGIELRGTSGTLRMDSQRLYLEGMNLRTAETDLDLDMTMDLNAFDSIAPGTLSIEARGYAGKGDIQQFAADMYEQFGRSWPDRPLMVDLSAQGNMQTLVVDRLDASIDGAFAVKGSATLINLDNPDAGIGIETRIKADGRNLAFIKGFLPADVAGSFNLPRGLTLDGDLAMNGSQINADGILRLGRAMARLKARYNTGNDAYDIDLDARHFPVSDFVPLPDTCFVSGHVKAKGRGFDFDSRHTWADATIDLDHASFGTYYLDGTHSIASLKNQDLVATTDFTDPRLIGHLDVDGFMTGKGLDATMALDLPFTDIYALGFADEPLTAHATHGDFEAHSNFGDLFLVNAQIEGVEVVLGGDSLVTEEFDLHAESTVDSTNITLQMSDMSLDLHAPLNCMTMIDQYTQVADLARQQAKTRSLNIDDLKQIMPEATLRADIGRKNPISKFIRLQGYEYDEVVANLHTSTEYGIQGNAHILGMKTDSMKVDTIMVDIYQDSTQIKFHAGASCPKQELTSAFNLYLDGFLSPHNSDLRLTMIDDKGKKGIDLGVKGEVTEADSVLHMNIYPEHPILGYSTFNVSEGNYIELHRKNRMFADVFLQSQDDSCSISLLAHPADTMMQDIEAVVKNLDLKGVTAVIPFAPKMTGLLEVNAHYVADTASFAVDGLLSADGFTYEGSALGDMMLAFDYNPVGTDGHNFSTVIYHDDYDIATAVGTYNVSGPKHLDTNVMINDLPLSMASAFVPDQVCAFSGSIDGVIEAHGPTDTLVVNGEVYPKDMHVYSDIYSFDLTVADEPIVFDNSRLQFNEIKIFGAGNNPLTVNGYVDFADLDEVSMNLSLYGQNFPVFDAARTRKSALFGRLNGDFFARVNGTTNDLKIRGLINVLRTTNITYIMTNTPLTVDYRLDDIVTFVDFSMPPQSGKLEPHTFMGIDMQVNLEIEDGAQVRCEFSADKQSYVNVQGGGAMTFNYSPEGVVNLIGRYTVNEGEMKYTLPVIPLKTFDLKKGSYVEFTGEAANPTLNISAAEQTKASVSNADGSSRSVLFNVGLRITGTLENMGLEFTIEAPEDMAVQNELAGMTAEDKNKLAVALLATGMYLSSTNSSGFSTTNALNNFLQNEINNIAGKAVSTAVNVDMNVGMEQTRRDDGTTRTDYSFKFTKRFFSDRLNVVVGGRINADGNHGENEAGAYIDDISLEWRLDSGGTQYIRLFHDKSYDNLIEGEMTENGAGILLRKKLDNLSELFIWKKTKTDDSGQRANGNDKEN